MPNYRDNPTSTVSNVTWFKYFTKALHYILRQAIHNIVWEDIYYIISSMCVCSSLICILTELQCFGCVEFESHVVQEMLSSRHTPAITHLAGFSLVLRLKVQTKVGPRVRVLYTGHS